MSTPTDVGRGGPGRRVSRSRQAGHESDWTSWSCRAHLLRRALGAPTHRPEPDGAVWSCSLLRTTARTATPLGGRTATTVTARSSTGSRSTAIDPPWSQAGSSVLTRLRSRRRTRSWSTGTTGSSFARQSRTSGEPPRSRCGTTRSANEPPHVFRQRRWWDSLPVLSPPETPASYGATARQPTWHRRRQGAALREPSCRRDAPDIAAEG